MNGNMPVHMCTCRCVTLTLFSVSAEFYRPLLFVKVLCQLTYNARKLLHIVITISTQSHGPAHSSTLAPPTASTHRLIKRPCVNKPQTTNWIPHNATSAAGICVDIKTLGFSGSHSFDKTCNTVTQCSCVSGLVITSFAKQKPGLIFTI